MKLLEYIQKQGGTGKRSCPVIAALALKAQCSAGTLYMVANGHKKPGPNLCTDLERATEGEVTREELRAEYFGQIGRKKKRVA